MCEHCGSFERLATDNFVEHISLLLEELFKATERGLFDRINREDHSELRLQCTVCLKQFVFGQERPGWQVESKA